MSRFDRLRRRYWKSAWATISFEQTHPAPTMLMVYQIKPERRGEIPAVTHVDGSGRLQTVSRAVNERYYQLISDFAALTGVPVVLNTSFNENEPIVCTPQARDRVFQKDEDGRAVSREFCGAERGSCGFLSRVARGSLARIFVSGSSARQRSALPR